MSAAERIVSDIKSRMRIGTDIDLDAYADHDEAAHIRPASEYEDAVWEHMHRLPHQKGGLLPWSKTHRDIQVRTGELSVWAGKRGEGKSLITSQVMLALMAQGHKAVIASLEMPVEDTLERMERQGLGVDDPTRDYHASFYRWAQSRLWMYEQNGVVPARRILGLCRYAITQLHCQHVVIDSLMMVGFPGIKSQFEKLELQGNFARDLAAIARDTGAHIHLVAHLRKGDGSKRHSEADDVKGGGEITDLASAVYIISGNREKHEEANKPVPSQKIMEQPDAWLSVEKNRRGVTGSRYGFWLHPQALQFMGKDSREPMQMIREQLPASSFGKPSIQSSASSSESLDADLADSNF